MAFDYLIEKIKAAPISREPFAHIEIQDFFSPEHFAAITATPEIALKPVASDEKLFDELFAAGWKIIGFPGCITDRRVYIDWHNGKNKKLHNNSACEGFGMTLRLVKPTSPMIAELSEFMASAPFKQALVDKFGIALDDVFFDGGVQKYLDGYEISPHPDIRRKALTYMININPHGQSDAQEHHTHYLTFKDEYRYVQQYWQGRPDEERCWVPWEWCETKKQQRSNNSIVIFSPDNDTMHGVKAKYDHLHYQRTQLYGNLWYHADPALPTAEWEDLVIHPGGHKTAQQAATLHGKLKALVPASVKDAVKQAMQRRKRDKTLIAARPNTGY